MLDLLRQPVPEAAFGLLGIAEWEVRPRAPVLAWPQVELVRSWISGLASSPGQTL